MIARLVCSALLILSVGSCSSSGDDPGDGGGNGSADGGNSQPGTMSFFVTSMGNGADGGNYGGLSGADERCQTLAAAAGAGARTWRAYLSTDADLDIGEAVDARDRIGAGPWHNAAGTLVASDVDGLHSGGIDSALMLDEMGNGIDRSEHDLLTGSGADGRIRKTGSPQAPDGRPATCQNWTSNSRGDFGRVGHSDGGTTGWNDVHDTRCSEDGLNAVSGAGRIMCFAID